MSPKDTKDRISDMAAPAPRIVKTHLTLGDQVTSTSKRFYNELQGPHLAQALLTRLDKGTDISQIPKSGISKALMSKTDFTDKHGRKFKNITVRQYALWTGDAGMLVLIDQLVDKIPDPRVQEQVKKSRSMQDDEYMNKGVTFELDGKPYCEPLYNGGLLTQALQKMIDAVSKPGRYKYDARKGFQGIEGNEDFIKELSRAPLHIANKINMHLDFEMANAISEIANGDNEKLVNLLKEEIVIVERMLKPFDFLALLEATKKLVEKARAPGFVFDVNALQEIYKELAFAPQQIINALNARAKDPEYDRLLQEAMADIAAGNNEKILKILEQDVAFLEEWLQPFSQTESPHPTPGL